MHAYDAQLDALTMSLWTQCVFRTRDSFRLVAVGQVRRPTGCDGRELTLTVLRDGALLWRSEQASEMSFSLRFAVLPWPGRKRPHLQARLQALSFAFQADSGPEQQDRLLPLHSDDVPPGGQKGLCKRRSRVGLPVEFHISFSI